MGGVDFVSAFDTKCLNLNSDDVYIRRLSRKHNMQVSNVEAVHKYFQTVDTDKSGYIEEPEFNTLLLALHGAKDPSEVPNSRLKFFWQQADSDGDGAIDFEEFLVWFNRYFGSDVDSRPFNG